MLHVVKQTWLVSDRMTEIHDRNRKLTTLCKQVEVPIHADPKNDLLLPYSAPSMKDCRRSHILRAQSRSSYTAQLIGYPKSQSYISCSLCQIDND